MRRVRHLAVRHDQRCFPDDGLERFDKYVLVLELVALVVREYDRADRRLCRVRMSAAGSRWATS